MTRVGTRGLGAVSRALKNVAADTRVAKSDIAKVRGGGGISGDELAGAAGGGRARRRVGG